MFVYWIVVPKALQKDTLLRIHQGHLGIWLSPVMQRCKLRAQSVVWWPGIMTQVEEQVKRCQVCVKEARCSREPMITSQLPDYQWQKVGSDLFELGGGMCFCLYLEDFRLGALFFIMTHIKKNVSTLPMCIIILNL